MSVKADDLDLAGGSDAKERGGEHTRPRVFQPAPRRLARAPTCMLDGGAAEQPLWSAKAPTTAREARALPKELLRSLRSLL